MRFSRAIIRELSSSYVNCVSDFSDHHLLNLDKAKKQHSQYVNLLKVIGLEIIKLEGDDKFPDCCFVEDTAVIHGNNAVITRMGINSRMGEIEAIQEILGKYKKLDSIVSPGTLEGGDILHVDEQNLLICGKSQRTNQYGINQLGEKLDCEIRVIDNSNIVHLKSYVTYLGNNTMLTTKEYKDHSALNSFTKLVIEEKEAYAANSLNINEIIIIPTGYSNTKKMLVDNGFDVTTLNISEFQKCDGALTCLSLLF